jgi:chromate transporter
LTQASALAQVTPGPLFTTATGAGYAIAGNAGAALATIGIFAPAFLSLAVGARVQRLVERSAVTRAALDGVVMASVALLGRAVVGFSMPLHAWQWLICVLAVLALSVHRGWGTMLLLAAMSVGIGSWGVHFLPA